MKGVPHDDVDDDDDDDDDITWINIRSTCCRIDTGTKRDFQLIFSPQVMFTVNISDDSVCGCRGSLSEVRNIYPDSECDPVQSA